MRLDKLVERARESPDGSEERREVAKRFALVGLAVLAENGVADAPDVLVRLVNLALKDARPAALFSERLWERLDAYDARRARAHHDLRFFQIQFVHDVPVAYMEPLEQAFIRPIPTSDPIAKLAAASPEQLARAYGKLLHVMLATGERDPEGLARRTKNFFPVSRVRKLKRRHESGRTATC